MSVLRIHMRSVCTKRTRARPVVVRCQRLLSSVHASPIIAPISWWISRKHVVLSDVHATTRPHRAPRYAHRQIATPSLLRALQRCGEVCKILCKIKKRVETTTTTTTLAPAVTQPVNCVNINGITYRAAQRTQPLRLAGRTWVVIFIHCQTSRRSSPIDEIDNDDDDNRDTRGVIFMNNKRACSMGARSYTGLHKCARHLCTAQGRQLVWSCKSVYKRTFIHSRMHPQINAAKVR